jgi:AcrR family transcriptional regulator
MTSIPTRSTSTSQPAVIIPGRPVRRDAERNRPLRRDAERNRPLRRDAERNRPVRRDAERNRPVRRDAERNRPLRRDAERNRQRILTAAAEVFTEQGLAATLDEVARRAGVGVGTVYRRFPDKEALAEELFEDRIDALATLAEDALAEPDEWTALSSFVEQAGTLLAADRVGEARARLQPVVSQLVTRAQAAGVVRADLKSTDIPLIEFMLSSVAEYAQHTRPEVWRRYLVLILDGLRPDRTGTTALPEPALSPAEIEEAMRAVPMRQP